MVSQRTHLGDELVRERLVARDLLPPHEGAAGHEVRHARRDGGGDLGARKELARMDQQLLVVAHSEGAVVEEVNDAQ